MFTVGNIGHLFVLSSFVFSFVFFVSYLISEKSKDKILWIKFGKVGFWLHTFSLFSVIIVLYYIIISDNFRYYYAFQHSSSLLPLYFKISSFWEGQEGSFLLWMFWNVIIGIYFILKPDSKWNSSLIVVLGFTQLLLSSMILGVVIYDLKIGSSPFILLRDAISAPIFQLDPSYIPEDGSGLNPLLQNYWMVIHPPTLFLGFAVCIVPFSFAISSLRLREYKAWIKHAKTWLIISIIILGIGIMMGAYWAYETLNFGGYWNWDPVENAVYVPWLFLVAALHSIILTQKNNQNYKMSLILCVASFILILYSTFLTRSGILGDSSVHSFTDLGLSGQLLIYLFSFVLISVYFLMSRWKEIPYSTKEAKVYTGDFWLFIGVYTLILMSFQVILPTSIPVYNAIVEIFGGFSNLAPPVEKELFYSNAQIWFASSLAIFSSIAQVLWWRGKQAKEKFALFSKSIVFTMIFSSLIILFYPITFPSYMVLITASLFSIFSNGSVLVFFYNKKNLLSSGSTAHIGLAIMLIGILFSSGYSSIQSNNYTGLVWNSDFPDEVNNNNMLLFLNEDRKVGKFDVNYLGQRKKIKGNSVYINSNYLEHLPLSNSHILKKDILLGDKLYKENDTVEVDNNDITYFELLFEDESSSFNLFPKVQTDPNSDMIVFSPDVKNNILEDFYVHVRTYPDPEQETIWSERDSVTVAIKETFFLNDFVSSIEKVNTKSRNMNGNQFIAEAQIKILSKGQEYIARPAFLIDNNKVGLIPDVIDDLGVKVYLSSILPQQEKFKVSFETTQKNWVIIEAMKKPLINLMWIGFFIMIFGLTLSLVKKK
jgi:cytochrome c-type biogenesis protein CcmF